MWTKYFDQSQTFQACFEYNSITELTQQSNPTKATNLNLHTALLCGFGPIFSLFYMHSTLHPGSCLWLNAVECIQTGFSNSLSTLSSLCLMPLFWQADLPCQNADYDYALYELADELKLGKLGPMAFAVYLPDPSGNTLRPKTYVISGWGSLSNTEMVRPKDMELQAAKVSSMPWHKCQKILSEAGHASLTKRQLCTETVGSAPRPTVGDSGGIKPS